MTVSTSRAEEVPGHSQIEPDRRTAPRLITASAVVVACAIAGLLLIPVGAWHQPQTDASYSGFDPNLIYVSTAGPASKAGEIDVSNDMLKLRALAGSRPTVDLVSTPLSFSTSFDVTVGAAPAGSVPLRIELWSPESGAAYVLAFEPDAGNAINAETVTGGTPLQDLVGGTVTAIGTLGTFQLNAEYAVALTVDQASRQVSARITGPGVTQTYSTINSSTSPDVFKAFRYALTVSSSASGEPSLAEIRHFSLSLPHQTRSSAESVVTIDDSRARFVTVALLAAAALVSVAATLAWIGRSRKRLVLWPARGAGWARAHAGIFVALAGGVLLYLLANAPLFGVASPHYDVWSSKVWAYVPSHLGLADLYYRTLLVPASAAWGGVPLHEAGFPYGFTKAYYYGAAGVLFDLGAGSSGTAPVSTFSLEALLKALNVLFGFADGILAYLILRMLIPTGNALTSALLLAINPAVVLVMSLWGSTETVSVFFIFMSILLAERGLAGGAWVSLAAAAYTRPQMLVLAFLLGTVYLRKFPPRQSVQAIAWTVILTFIAIAPFALSISPSMPIDYIERTLIFHFGNGQADLPYLGVSPGYYSIWTLPLLLVSGQHNLGRMWSPSTQQLFGSLTYGQVGAGASVLFLIALAAVILLRRTVTQKPGQYLPFLAFGMLGWLMVTPGLISRYFVYAIVLIILCRKVFSTPQYLWVLAPLTVVTCVTAYGHLALDFLGYTGNVSLMSPTNNGFSEAVFSLFESDWFISLGTLTNIAILAVLGIKAWVNLRDETVPRLQAA